MVRNHKDLLESSPIERMIPHKHVSPNTTTTFGLGEAGYDIRIKQDITFYRLFGLIPLIKVVDENSKKYSIGRFTLASAIEKFSIPEDLVAIVHDKSTWARRALSVFNTVAEPGWKGYLTLELVYHGRKKLHIPAGSGIAQVVFHELTVKQKYTGRYQNQQNKPIPAKSAE